VAIAAVAQPNVPTAPIEAELLSRVTARNTIPGAIVYARVTADWSGPGCTLRRGATLEATVPEIVPHSFRARDSRIAIAFQRAQCGGSALQPLRLTLQAIAAPADPNLGSLPTDLPILFGLSSTSGKSLAQHPDPLAVDAHRFPAAAPIRPGEVLGIRWLKLKVGSGPENSSVLSRAGGDVQLEEHTRLLLLPSQATPDAANPDPPDPPQPESAQSESPASPLKAIAIESALAPQTPADDDSELCVPPACSLAASGLVTSGEEHFAGSVPLRALGYAPRTTTEMLAPDDDEALAWLGPTELLVAFNPHLLVPRHGIVTPGSIVRVVRAALVNISTGAIQRTVEWGLSDQGQFLWPLPGNRVLVHVENELRVYGPGLRREKRIPLGGPLAFARVSPDGKFTAIGILRERHTPELHATLLAMLDHEPDEDVQVSLLNERFEAVAFALSSSDRSPPVLLNEGQVELLATLGQQHRGNQYFGLQLRTWDHQSRSVGRFSSSCVPQLSSLPPDLLFLVTCDHFNSGRHYRVLRPNGQVILQGRTMVRDLGHGAGGNQATSAFAVRIFEADEPILPGQVFHGADLDFAQVGIYRSLDGKRLFTAREKDPAASSAGYAVSARGQVAILGRDRVDLYAIPNQALRAAFPTPDPGSVPDPQAEIHTAAGLPAASSATAQRSGSPAPR
jgi:hypothetical protein